jgi:hypothetical protein
MSARLLLGAPSARRPSVSHDLAQTPATDERRESRGAVGPRLLRGTGRGPLGTSVGTLPHFRGAQPLVFVAPPRGESPRFAGSSCDGETRTRTGLDGVPGRGHGCRHRELMARPGLEPGTPRFSGSRRKAYRAVKDLQTGRSVRPTRGTMPSALPGLAGVWDSVTASESQRSIADRPRGALAQDRAGHCVITPGGQSLDGARHVDAPRGSCDARLPDAVHASHTESDEPPGPALPTRTRGVRCRLVVPPATYQARARRRAALAGP